MTVAANETAHVKYRVVEGRICFFRRRISLFELRWNTPLEVKGTIAWSDDRLSVVGRYPLSVMVFFTAWLVGWTMGGIRILADGQLVAVPFLALGWVFLGGIVAHSRFIERKRFLAHAAEASVALRGGSA